MCGEQQETHLRQALITAIALLWSFHAQAGGFRCGTKLVVTGDPVSRLVRNCGQPAYRYKSSESIGGRGKTRLSGVTNWVYERGRRKDMIVSVQGGRVVKITVE